MFSSYHQEADQTANNKINPLAREIAIQNKYKNMAYPHQRQPQDNLRQSQQQQQQCQPQQRPRPAAPEKLDLPFHDNTKKGDNGDQGWYYSGQYTQSYSPVTFDASLNNWSANTPAVKPPFGPCGGKCGSPLCKDKL